MKDADNSTDNKESTKSYVANQMLSSHAHFVVRPCNSLMRIHANSSVRPYKLYCHKQTDKQTTHRHCSLWTQLVKGLVERKMWKCWLWYVKWSALVHWMQYNKIQPFSFYCLKKKKISIHTEEKISVTKSYSFEAEGPAFTYNSNLFKLSWTFCFKVCQSSGTGVPSPFPLPDTAIPWLVTSCSWWQSQLSIEACPNTWLPKTLVALQL